MKIQNNQLNDGVGGGRDVGEESRPFGMRGEDVYSYFWVEKNKNSGLRC